jgi:hypothetical protein
MYKGTSHMRILGVDKASKFAACRLADGQVVQFGKGHEVALVKATVVIELPEREDDDLDT